MSSLAGRAWRQFRGVPIAFQVACWVVLGALVLGAAIGGQQRKTAAAEPTSTTSVTSTTEHGAPVLASSQHDVDHPSAALTPGAIFADATAETVCVPGYSASVRDVSSSVRDQVFAAYGLNAVDRSQYEVDHLIALELGGSNDLKNLWPEPMVGADGAKAKDVAENHLHDLVCNSQVSLTDAQAAIVHWDSGDTTALTTTTTTTAAPTTTAPQITAPAPDCTPGYDPCIPPGSDVDCAGGSGNGPRYVQGPVYVTGSDPYGLDTNHDGVACAG